MRIERRTQFWTAALALFLVHFLGCGEAPQPAPHPPDVLHFPTHLFLSPDQGTLHVANSNFDLKYQSGAIVSIDLDTHEFDSRGSLSVPSFPGNMQLQEYSEGNWMLYWTDRKNGELRYSPYDADSDLWFACERDPTEGGCTARYRASTGNWAGEERRMERDPYALGVVSNPFGESPLLISGGLLDPKVTLWSLSEEGVPVMTDQITLVNGITDVKEHPVTGTPYVAAQYANALYPLPLANGERSDQTLSFGPIQPIPIPTDIVLGQPIYGFQIAFSPLGALAFLSYRYPASVAVVDTSPDPTGNPVHTTLGLLEMGANPTGLEVVESPDGETFLFASSASRGEVYAFRLSTLALVGVVRVGRGAGDMVWRHNPETGTTRLYVSLFEENGVAVVDIEPDSPFYLQHIATLR